MSGLKNTVKRMANASMGKGYMTKRERDAKKAGKETARLDAIYAGADLPDEEAVGREARRRQARSKGSRASTVLTDSLG